MILFICWLGSYLQLLEDNKPALPPYQNHSKRKLFSKRTSEGLGLFLILMVDYRKPDDNNYRRSVMSKIKLCKYKEFLISQEQGFVEEAWSGTKTLAPPTDSTSLKPLNERMLRTIHQAFERYSSVSKWRRREKVLSTWFSRNDLDLLFLKWR